MHKSFLIGFGIIFASLLIGSIFLVRYAVTQRDERNRLVAEQKVPDIKVTIIEGKRREEIARQLDVAGVCDYDAFLAASANLEGKLFPDTYRFFANTPAGDVVAELTKNYNNRVAKLSDTPLPKGLTSADQALILASIIEREAQTNAERATISGVYLNRLRIGMKLDADPTTQYGKDSLALAAAEVKQDFKFWGVITRNDYVSVNSPYNTYRTVGLPPGPIANPGIASITAAYQPEDHSYLYFFHRNGQLYPSKTLAEHEQKLSQF